MHALKIAVVYDDGSRETVSLYRGATAYLDSGRETRSARVFAPKGHIAALVGKRIDLYPSIDTAKHEEQDVITRLFDDEGHELS